jgi:hypothetical protein
MTPKQLLDVLDGPNVDDMSEKEKIKPADCGRKYLAKRYSTIREMQSDNSEDELFFDKDLDDTPYDIMKHYKKEKSTLLPELFSEFLERSLIDKHDCPKDQAKELAKTLIAGKKLVSDGDYAVLELKPQLPSSVDEEKLTEKEKKAIQLEADARKKTQYYRMIKGNWVKDKDIDEEAFLDTNTIFCNVSEKCYKNPKNSVCEPVDDAYERMKLIAKKKMLGEFDQRYAVNIDELEKQLEDGIRHGIAMLRKMEHLNEIKLYKATRLAFALGSEADVNDIIMSPHLKIRDLILGQDDFVKKQYDICRFVETYCREPMVDNLEDDQHWFYCKDTNTKLFPMSIHLLAKTFISGDDYQRKLDEVCNSVGIMSDDGDAIVDKFCGFVIRKIDFSSEEGFDEAGFRVQTHDLLEKDLGEVMMEKMEMAQVNPGQGTTVKRVFENEVAEVIYNVAATICRNIDIPLDPIEELILVMSRELFDKAIFSEAAYQKLSDKNLKDKGKALQPYLNYRDETRVFIITCNVLVAIQTAVPSFKTNKTMPGCVRSFSGYPLSGGVEDMSGLTYLACVLEKSKNKESDPWASIAKYKPEGLAKNMKNIFDKYVMKRSDVLELYVKKREFMILQPELVAPEEHRISKWTHFFPPVVKFSVLKTITNVASDFASTFREDMRKGSANQHNSYGVVQSKMLQYGYGMIESINVIVKTKDLVLRNSANIPFLENACCNDQLQLTNPISYFNEEDEKIAQFIVSTAKLASLAKFARQAATPGFLYHSEFTGVRYASVSENNLDDVELIYSAIIHYCNFDKNKPIPEIFKTVCNEKPAGYKSNWTIFEKVEFLKSHAHQFNVDHLQQLMTLVHRSSIVNIVIPEQITKATVMKEILEQLDTSHSTVIHEPLRRFLFKLMDQYKPKCMSYEISKELFDMKNYLIVTNRDLYKQIIEFFGKYGNLSESKYEKVHQFLTGIEKWKLDTPMKETGLYYDQGLFTVTQFMMNAIQNLCRVYPSILVNDMGFYKKVPQHWGFSDKHRSIIAKFLEQYYEKIEKFKGDSVLLRLLQEVGVRLTDLPIFLQHLPFFTEMVKDFGDEVEGERVRSFHCLFDKESVYLIFVYCFYSAIYEYIVCANDPDLLRSDMQTVKQSRREEIRELSNPSNGLLAKAVAMGTRPGDIDDFANDMDEIEIITGDLDELKRRVASLLLCFLTVEEENKEVLDYTYEEIMQKVKRDKDVEKQGIIEKLGQMSIEARRVENDLKNYRIGRWNVGEQKGLYQYDKKTFDREIDELRLGDEIEFVDSNGDEVGLGELLVEGVDNDLENGQVYGEGPDDFYERGQVDISELGDNFTDGVFYDEDRDFEN